MLRWTRGTTSIWITVISSQNNLDVYQPAIYLKERVTKEGLLLLDRVPIPSVQRMVSYSVEKQRVDSYTGRRARGRLVSGAVVADPIPSTGEGWFPIPRGGEGWTPILAVGRGVDCFPLPLVTSEGTE